MTASARVGAAGRVGAGGALWPQAGTSVTSASTWVAVEMTGPLIVSPLGEAFRGRILRRGRVASRAGPCRRSGGRSLATDGSCRLKREELGTWRQPRALSGDSQDRREAVLASRPGLTHNGPVN